MDILSYDVVIVGGGPAGVTCAISAHNTYPDKKIALIRKEQVALVPCGIPYTMYSLSGVDEDILPDKLLDSDHIEIIIDEVVDRKEKTLKLKSGRDIKYDKLVIATGSVPSKLPFVKQQMDGIYYVNKDRDQLLEMRKKFEKANSIAIVGGGYIGVEFAEEVIRADKKLTIIEMQDRLFPLTMDQEFGAKVKDIIMGDDGRLILGKQVKSITRNDNIIRIVLDDGEEISAAMVIISIGFKPNISLGKLIGLDCDTINGIHVNEYQKTANQDIYAIGDCAAKYDFFTGEYSNVRLASTAMAEGRLVGSDLFKIKVIRKYNRVLGSFSTVFGNTAFGVTGITEEKAKAMDLDYTVGVADTIDHHPGSLCGASKIHLKLIFSRYSHTLLGAQMYGGQSVGELVNMFSVMILNKMTDMDIDTLQIGTHPYLTSSPIAYPAITATVDAIKKWYK